MRKLFLGLIVAGAAFGTSAFTSAAPKTHAASVYYVLTAGGTYVRTANEPVTGNCETGGNDKCWIGYDEDHGEFLNPDALPSAPITAESPSNGIYQ